MMSILSLACREDHFAAWDGHVFFGVRTARDGFFLDELQAFRARFLARLAVTVALSDEDVPTSLAAAYPGFAFARGFVHAVAGERMKGRYGDVRAYVAGPPPMVDASLRLLLREARLPPADIATISSAEAKAKERRWASTIVTCSSVRAARPARCRPTPRRTSRASRAGVQKANRQGDVRVNKAGCFSQCGHGPMIVVYPENVWYAGVQESDLDEILSSHIIGATPSSACGTIPA